MRPLVTILIGVAVGSCTAGTEPDAPEIQPAAAVQRFARAGGLLLSLEHASPDTLLAVEVRTVDSAAHVEWSPARVTLEAGGTPMQLLLEPNVCIVPREALDSLGFPFTFEWLHCSQVAVTTHRVLDHPDIEAAETAVNGTLVRHRAFRARDGGFYAFSVPVGRAQTATAVDRLAAFPFIEQASRMGPSLSCLAVDVVPPPPCPPWSLEAAVTLSGSHAQRSGDTVRATYLQPDSTVLTALLVVP